jgi:hypothetical protein
MQKGIEVDLNSDSPSPHELILKEFSDWGGRSWSPNRYQAIRNLIMISGGNKYNTEKAYQYLGGINTKIPRLIRALFNN